MTAPLLERDGLLDQALALRDAVAGREGRVLLVSGEAGVGKSSFIAALLERAAAEGLRCAAAGCEALSVPRPLGPWRELAETGLPLLQRSLARDEGAAAHFAALQAELQASRQPQLLAIEDLHWADGATLDLLRFAGRRLAGLPLLLVLSFRDEELDESHPLRRLLADLPAARCLRLALPALSLAAVAQLCTAAGRPGAEGVHAVTAGNAFFVTELLASALPDAREGVPSTVRDAVLARLQQLEPGARALLQRLALLPGGADPALALALRPEGSTAADLDLCVERGLLRLQGGRLQFRHELARRAVADPLPPMQRRLGHAQILAQLQTRPNSAPAALAHHAEAAGDITTLLQTAPAAASAAAAAGAHREAALLLQSVLPHADQLPPAEQAELHERWSYEAGLALGIDAAVLAARQQALALWRQLGRRDKQALNHRWLSRLHWYLGQAAEAEREADAALALLPDPQSPEEAAEQGWALATRAQLHMLRGETEAALRIGQQAVACGEALGHAELLCHALNTRGTAELLATGSNAGLAPLQRSLELARAGGFHEQAARVYTNVSYHLVLSHQAEAAQHWLHEGIAFDRSLDLDAWTSYLEGWQGVLWMDQGRWDEALQLAERLLAQPRQTALMRLPALTLRARLLLRRGEVGAAEALQAALQPALAIGELPRLLPLRLAEIENAWLQGETARAQRLLEALPALPPQVVDNPWQGGEVQLWRQRLGLPVPDGDAAPPWALELQGRAADAAQAWLALGQPYEAALALLQAGGAALAQAAALLRPLQAGPALALLRQRAQQQGLRLPGGSRPRSCHPLGLTAREQQVLKLLAHGSSNAQIGTQLGLAARTVEHHVSALLAKLDVRSRSEAVARAWRERWVDEERSE